jgi:twitching motility protein PilT
MSLEAFNHLLLQTVEKGASDLILKSGHHPSLRVSGRLLFAEADPTPQGDLQFFLDATMPRTLRPLWEQDGQVDYSYLLPNIGRFRVNGFIQQGTISIVCRHIKNHVPTFQELNLAEDILVKLIHARDGVVIVSGATGSGKSSTLAAMLDFLNHSVHKHIITLEDPIEYTFVDDKCVFQQREMGIDAPSFQLALKSVLRQAPDIILIGEMRDETTFETALSAAETGHLVLTTMHASTVLQSLERLFEFFPAGKVAMARRQVANALRGIVCQKLIPAIEGGGRLPAQEVLVVDAVARNFIAEGQFEKIPQLLDQGGESGSRSFNRDIMRLIKTGQISKADGLRFSPNSQALEMGLKGILFKS